MIRPILLQDLEFDQIKLQFLSTRGSPYFRRIRFGMPRIPQSVIDSVFFLYANRADAEKGENPGGTGFIVSMRGECDHVNSGYDEHYYAVTNWHVACHDHCYSVIRLNTTDGATDILDFGPEDWTSIASDADVAALSLDLNQHIHKVNSISTDLFAMKPDNRYHHDRIGVGDDVFMLGLFVDHAGTTMNVPKARFGNISMMPTMDAPIKQPRNYLGESYIVDMRSRGGFSGSPVFVYRTPLREISGDWSNTHFPHETRLVGRLKLEYQTPRIPREIDIPLSVRDSLFRFLGIHWMQFGEERKIGEGKESHENALTKAGNGVRGPSGMTCVIPAWKILEVLNVPTLKSQREEKAKKNSRSLNAVPILESDDT